MFETNSRYVNIEDASIEINGEEKAFKKRRFLPQGDDMTMLQEVRVEEGDRLDMLAARLLGDPEQFWYICDSNNTMHPLELTSNIGSQIWIARPWG